MRPRHPRPAPATRSAFAGFRFPPEVIVLAVRWYLRFGLSDRDVEELLAERGAAVDHVTVYRWVQRFTPLLAEAARPCHRRVGDRWFVAETYVKVAGRWRYVYRAVDQFVRLGVQLSDGRKATNLHRPRPPRAGEPPAGQLLTPRGSSETQGAWEATYWLWPLPPPGRLLIVAEWPVLHLSETRAEVDADPILEAAAPAVTLWPEDDDLGRQVGHAPIAGGG